MPVATDDWQSLLPPTRGQLPNGTPIPRTDPAGSFDADVVILGLYPAAKVRLHTVEGQRMNLPTQVEATSFEPGVSESSQHIDTAYLQPIGLTRAHVLLLDAFPYFMANTRNDSGRTMLDNVHTYEALTGQTLGIEGRPPKERSPEIARSLPGNLERLQEYFGRMNSPLLLTLGVEVAAFVRGESYAAVNRHKQESFYAEPVGMEVFGKRLRVVHLAHPGLIMMDKPRVKAWQERHERWCAGFAS